jgi:hypothetical protein
MIGVALVSLFLISLGAMLAAAVVSNPAAAGYTIVGVVGFFATIIGLAIGHEYLQGYKEKNPEPKTLVGKQYTAYKSKICPTVEFGQ